MPQLRRPPSLLLLAACLLPFPSAGAADPELRSIELISTRRYDPREERGRGLRTFFTGIGVAIGGAGIDLRKAIAEKLDTPAIREYLPDARERARLADRIASETKRRHLSNGFSNRSVNAALEYATSEMVKEVVAKIFAKEGIRDRQRAQEWSAKILAPFQRCMGLSRNYKEGQRCSGPLEADIEKNLGLALSFEISRQEFGARYARERPAEFRRCLRLDSGSDSANRRVKECVFAGFRRGALALARAKVLEAARRTVPAAADRIAAKLMPPFERCLGGARDRPGFSRCADRLLSEAGAEISAETIRGDARLTRLLPRPADRERVAAAGRESFLRCMRENEQAQLRDGQGNLRTDNCESYVRLETSRTVAIELFRTGIDQALPGLPSAERQALHAELRQKLHGCWDSRKTEAENAPCLRSSAIALGLAAAERKIARELPPGSDPALRGRLLGSFRSCIEQRLPQNLFEAENAFAPAELCAAEIYRGAALEIAEQRVRQALQGKLASEEAVEAIIRTLVREDFPRCLGERPDEARLARCARSLQKNVALRAAAELLPSKVNEFLGPDLAAYGLDEEKKTALVQAVLAGHKQCLRNEVAALQPEETEAEISACFKKTVRDLALRLGPLELAKAARENEIDPKGESFQAISREFQQELAACLDRRKAPGYTLDHYIQGVDACKTELAASFTSKVAKAELEKALRQAFPESEAAAREALKNRLFAELDGCMASASTAPQREQCLLRLKSGAMVSVAKAGVRAKALRMLGGAELPAELKAHEGPLDACVAERKKSIEACSIDYVKNATKSLGRLVLNPKLKTELGEEKFQRLEAARREKLEQPFDACVDAARGSLGPALLEGLDSCAAKLEENVLEFVLNHMDDTPPPREAIAPVPRPVPAKEASEEEIAEMLTRSLLCVNSQLDPAHEQGLRNLEPGSMEAELLKLIGGLVSYDARNARDGYAELLRQVGQELAAAGPVPARRKMLGQLAERGLIDQLMKAVVRGELERQLAALPAERRPSPELQRRLLDKARIDRALSGAAMDRLRPRLTDEVLKPVIVDGKSLQSSDVLRALRAARAQGIQALLDSAAPGGDEAAALRLLLAK